MSKLVTRAYIADGLGITNKQLSNLYHKKLIKLPPCVGRKRSTLYYHAHQADEFINSDPLKAENLLKGGLNKKRHPQLDIAEAITFITKRKTTAKPLTMAELVKKYTKPVAARGKTTVVHLQERNDYEHPHSALTRSSNNCNHRLAVSF